MIAFDYLYWLGERYQQGSRRPLQRIDGTAMVMFALLNLPDAPLLFVGMRLFPNGHGWHLAALAALLLLEEELLRRHYTPERRRAVMQRFRHRTFRRAAVVVWAVLLVALFLAQSGLYCRLLHPALP